MRLGKREGGIVITGKTRLAGVMGWPVSHSRSPLIHNFWLVRHGIDGAYVPLPVAAENFRAAVKGLRAAGFCGVNVTLPHKEAAAEAADTLDEASTHIGAVNTLVFGDDGITGMNTDCFGFSENLRQSVPGWNAARGPAVVLGAGGGARAILYALLRAGAPEIRLVNRTHRRAEELAARFGDRVRPLTWENAAAALAEAALLVNTTSLGMEGQPALDLALDTLPSEAVVTDIVYAPLETNLLAAARARGNETVDGLGMLLHQARAGFASWFGVDPEVDAELRAHVLNPRSN